MDSSSHRRPDAAGLMPADLATAVLTGLVTTYLPVQRWSPAARWSLHGGMGVLAAGGMAYALRHPERFSGRDAESTTTVDSPDTDDPPTRLSPLATTALAVGFGSLVTGMSRGGEGADAWVERTLARRGVPHPRLWLGVAASVLSLAMSLVDRRRDAAEPDLDSLDPTG